VDREVTLAQFERWLDFLARSGIVDARLLGGEPTGHPHFAGLVEAASTRGYRITVFTNGLMSDRQLAILEHLPPDACTVVVNCNEPDDSSAVAHRRRLGTLTRLGARAYPGYTIYRTDFDPGFLLDLIATSGCRPRIRVGLAHPRLAGDNDHVHPAQYPIVGDRIARFAAQAAATGTVIALDCGFVPCMFAPDALAALVGLGAEVGWMCSPILDLRPDDTVVHCFPLADGPVLALDDRATADGLRRAFSARTAPYRHSGIYRRCRVCPEKQNGACSGGCLAAVMRRFRPAPDGLECPKGALEAVEPLAPPAPRSERLTATGRALGEDE